jgi:uncharacterized protein (DUF302 family)
MMSASQLSKIELSDGSSVSPDGLITLPSGYGPKETMDRLANAVTARGMTILALIDHAEAAAQAISRCGRLKCSSLAIQK